MAFSINSILLKKVVISLLLVILGSGVFAQVDSVRLNGKYIKHYWTDSRDLIVSPLKWDKKDLLRFGIYAGTTTAFFFADEPVKDFFQNHRTQGMDHVTHDFFSPLGGTWSVFISAGYYGLGLARHNGRMQSTGLMAVESYLVGSVIARIPKIVFGRVRPDAWDHPSAFRWEGPFGGSSFPSGHTAAAFSVAAVFATQYRQIKWVPVLSYSLAAAVGLSRIYENRHWTSDVFTGAIIGLITGKFICKSFRNEDFSVAPCFDGPVKGLTFVYHL